jgi:predicted transposase YbfD/YdcC
MDIVVIVLLAKLANADDWHEIEIFAQKQEELLRKYVELANGIPSHDTIQRVMGMIKPEVMEGLQARWNEYMSRDEGEALKKVLSLDGKTMRGNGNKNQEALHVVSAWCKDEGICFGQKAACGKGNEIPLIKKLLGEISVKGHIVTIDAIGTQTEIAEMIVKGKGDYVLAVKGNQQTLFEEIKTYFADAEFVKTIREEGGYEETTEKAHGQIERREYYQTADIQWLTGRKQWKGLASIGMSRAINKKDGKETMEERYYISTLPVVPSLFRQSVRGHWSVESMHWHLDVTFREDSNKTLDKVAAENLNIIRKWALSILKLLDLGKPYSLKKKRFALCCAFPEYIGKLMAL